MAATCEKCGRALDATPYGEGKEAVIALGSDHASRHGCDYVASHVPELTKKLYPKVKKTK